jgi:hypothetical protein
MRRWLLFWSTLAVVAALGPGDLLYLGMGLGIAAVAWGRRDYRRPAAQPATRLAGAAAMALGSAALILSGTRYALTWWAIGHLGRQIG